MNVWVTKWNTEEQMIQIRTYIDSTISQRMLHENEVWWNATYRLERPKFLPGPAGMPNMTELEEFIAEIDRSHHQGLDH